MKVLNLLGKMHDGMEATHTFPGHSRLIGGAKVPIVTGKVITGQQVDISYQPLSKPDLAGAGVGLMRHYLSDFPQTRPLLLVFKALLKQQDLNTVRFEPGHDIKICWMYRLCLAMH
jgi:hypothetical protein